MFGSYATFQGEYIAIRGFVKDKFGYHWAMANTWPVTVTTVVGLNEFANHQRPPNIIPLQYSQLSSMSPTGFARGHS